MKQTSTLSIFAGGICAVLATIGVMIAWPSIQPVVLSVEQAISGTLTPGGSWMQDFLEHLVIPGLPIAVPVVTFALVFLGVSRFVEQQRR